MRVARQGLGRGCGDQGRVPVHDHALTRHRHGRRHQLRPGLAAIGTMREAHAVHHAGNGHGSGTLHVAVVHHQGPGEEIRGAAVACERIVGRVQAARRAHAEVHHPGAAFVGAPQHHAAAGGHAAHPRLHHPQGEGSGHGGIHGIAACSQHRRTHVSGPPMLRGHHASFGGHHMFANVLGIGEVVSVLGHAGFRSSSVVSKAAHHQRREMR